MTANAEIVRSFQEALAGNPVTAIDLLADDVVWHVPGKNPTMRGRVAVG